MYYSLIGLLALLVLTISNYDVILNGRKSAATPAQRIYYQFLLCVAAYYIMDILWGVLDSLALPALLYADTVLYFLAMGAGILFWTRFVVAYLADEDKYGKLLSRAGQAFFAVFVLLLLVNLFTPILFRFDETGSYQTGPMRHVMLIAQVLMFLITAVYALCVTAKTADADKRNRHLTVGLSGLIMVVLLTVQLFFPLLPLYSIAYMLGCCLLRTFVIENEKETYHKDLEASLLREQEHLKELSSSWELAYTDALTGVRSKLAYSKKEAQLNGAIAEGTAKDMAAVVFDLNGLKQINDTLGHEVGDRYIKDACRLICVTFEHSPVYRVGGDEFVAILEGADYENRQALMAQFDREVEENRAAGKAVVAAGLAEYARGEDERFERVFQRADQRMYLRKQELKKADA